MNLSHRLRSAALLLATAALLAACGGGGGGDTPAGAPAPGAFAPSSTYAGVCTLEGQKQFTRSYMDEAYLWYRDIPPVDAARYQTVPDYFHALLVTTPDVNGLPRDRHSTVLPTSVSQGLLQQSAALLSAGAQTVPVVKVVTSPAGRPTGYIQFNDHAEGAQDALINAFRQVRDAGAQDLVLDLRYNGGGYLYIALAAASMVTSPASEGQLFESLRYNDKRANENANSFLTFSSHLQFGETQYGRGAPLPQLGLKRLYVLTSSQTCSSSESIINSLRGIDVDVVLVGQTTCGKPFGFTRHDNCGYAYFPIEFQGFNAKGYGDYTAGFRPTCNVADSSAAAAGSAADPLLAAALHHVDQGACPAGTAGVLKAASPQASVATPSRPAWAGRLLRAP